MGLNVTYSRCAIRELDAAVDADGSPVDHDRHKRIFPNQDYPGRAEEIVEGGIYELIDCDRFYAGSYSGYNQWRDRLAKLVGYAARYVPSDPHEHYQGALAADSGPFWELINFTDCEGVIGAAVSAKLAADFASHQADVDAITPAEPQFAALYARWRGAFQTAANGGVVLFH